MAFECKVVLQQRLVNVLNCSPPLDRANQKTFLVRKGSNASSLKFQTRFDSFEFLLRASQVEDRDVPVGCGHDHELFFDVHCEDSFSHLLCMCSVARVPDIPVLDLSASDYVRNQWGEVEWSGVVSFSSLKDIF